MALLVDSRTPRGQPTPASIPKGTVTLARATCVGRSTEICKPLDDNRLAQLLSLGGKRRCSRGEVIFREGSPIGSLFKITEAIIAVSCTLADGRRQIIGIHPPGDCVGYLEANGNYLFQREALANTAACAVDRRKFDLFAMRNPDVAASISEGLASRLNQAGHKMTVISQPTAIERVANSLIEIERLDFARGLPTKPLTLHRRRNEIADHLGLMIETVSRSFTKLKNRNVIALIESDAIVILDIERLAEIGSVE